MDATNPPAARRGPGRARRWLARAALALGSLLLGLVAAEVAVRASGVFVPARGDAGSQGNLQAVPNDVARGVGFELRPGQTSATYPGAPGEEPRVVTYRVNELGFRGAPVAPEKPAHVYRIVALGDSFTYGTAVNDDETWPAQLGARLRELAPDREIEVLNWGVPAYNTRQEIAQLNQRAGTYRPDLVIICAYVNDASGEERGRGAEADRTLQSDIWETRWIRDFGLTSGRWEEDTPMSPAQRRMMALRKRSRLADLLAYKLNAWLMGRIATRNYTADWTPDSPGVAMVRGALSTALILSRQDGFELQAVMYPDLPSLGETYAFAEQHAVFAALCADVGIPFHDLTPVFEGRDPATLQAHAHDKHPNGSANRLVAETLATLLLPRIVRE
jgi:lysophospholipase L1-like esterase